jgi:hypothetical protein
MLALRDGHSIRHLPDCILHGADKYGRQIESTHFYREGKLNENAYMSDIKIDFQAMVINSA